jgi:hypothetical protein
MGFSRSTQQVCELVADSGSGTVLCAAKSERWSMFAYLICSLCIWIHIWMPDDPVLEVVLDFIAFADLVLGVVLEFSFTVIHFMSSSL